MANFQNQYGAVQRTPGYEEMSVQTDAYGNPVHHTAGTTTGVYGITAGTGLGGGLHGLRRSGSSSSSSSSEDDGQGGRRKKKGLKEKIKEKLAGVERSQTSATTTPGGYGVTGEGQLHHHQKKGMMEKIKDKLPGHHHHHHHHHD